MLALSSLQKTFYQKINFFLRQHSISSSATFIIAFSGGADSVALLDLMYHLPKQAFSFILVYVRHNLRSLDSLEKEKILIENYAQKYTLPLEYKVIPVDLYQKNKEKKSIGLEALARYYRYQFLSEIKHKYQADYVLLAHHRDDQEETILMRFLSGASEEGLKGMKSKHSFYLRPLLTLSKSQILAYVQEKNLVYSQDSSNQDTHYLRNQIRLMIYPFLKKYYPHLPKQLEKIRQRSLFHSQMIQRASSQLLWQREYCVSAYMAYIDLSSLGELLWPVFQRSLFQEINQMLKSFSQQYPLIQGHPYFQSLHRWPDSFLEEIYKQIIHPFMHEKKPSLHLKIHKKKFHFYLEDNKFYLLWDLKEILALVLSELNPIA